MKTRYLLVAGFGMVALHFLLVFTVPPYRQAFRNLFHKAGVIGIKDLQQVDYVRQTLELSPATKGKSIVALDKQPALIIAIDREVSDPDAFKKSFEEIRKRMVSDFKCEPLPFVVKTKNYEFKIPNDRKTRPSTK